MIPTLYLAAAGVLVSVALGAGAARLYYAPRLEAARSDAAVAWAKVELQNGLVLGMQRAADARREKTNQALAAAKTKQRAAETRAAELLARPLPPGKSACQAACDLLLEPIDQP